MHSFKGNLEKIVIVMGFRESQFSDCSSCLIHTLQQLFVLVSVKISHIFSCCDILTL